MAAKSITENLLSWRSGACSWTWMKLDSTNFFILWIRPKKVILSIYFLTKPKNMNIKLKINSETLYIYRNRNYFRNLLLRARLHETRSELKPVWNLKPFWNVVPFTWQFTWRFHCGNFPNNSKALLHMCKWYLLINANLINAKKCSQW